MRVLIADTFEQSGIDALGRAGCQVLYEPDLKDAALEARLRTSDARVLVVRSTAVGAAALEAGSLALVVRAGAGYNTIDVAAASRRGIYVSNCPGRNAFAVAELTMGLILAIDRRIPDNVADLRAGRWNKKEYSKARGLSGRSLGLLGFGSIGHEVARRAHAFGMRVRVWSRRFAEGAARAADCDVPIELVPSPPELAARSDILSVHLALTPATKGFCERVGPRRARARGVLHQHGPRRDRGLRGPRARRRLSWHQGRPGRLRRRARQRHGRVRQLAGLVARRVRHASHWRLHRTGAGGDRRGDRPHRARLHGYRTGAERCQPRDPHAGDAPAHRPASRPPRTCSRTCSSTCGPAA